MSGYTPDSKLELSVWQGNTAMVRAVLQAILNNNIYPDDEINNALEWTNEHLKGLFEDSHPEIEPQVSDRSKWDADYYYMQETAVGDNFSRDRFLHLIEIRNHLREKGHPDFILIRRTTSQDAASTTKEAGSQKKTPNATNPAPKSRTPSGCAVALVSIVALGIVVSIVLTTRFR